MNASVFSYWTGLVESSDYTLEEKVEAGEKAIKTLTHEIESGVLIGIEYHAELQLLKSMFN